MQSLNFSDVLEALQDDSVRRVATYKCLDSLLYQTRFFFKCINKKFFAVNEHHLTICNALEKVLRGEITRLIINIAPRYGKTEIAVKHFIGHGLALNAMAKFIHLSYSDTLALDNSEEVKDLVESAEYQALFPHVKVKHDSKSKKKWYTTAGGGVYATAAGGQVTGFGAGDFDPEAEKGRGDRLGDDDNELISEIEELDRMYISEDGELHNIEIKYTFAGAIVIDDPIKPDDADSSVIRDRINNRFDSTIKNRVNSRKTPIIIIMQRLHPKDLCGYLIDRDASEWTVISLPCIMTVNVDGRLEERALWPDKHTLEELKKMEKDDPVSFGRQYQQRPMPKEGLMFALEDLKYFDRSMVKWEQAEYRVFIGDPADKGGDMFAGPLAYVFGDGCVLIRAVTCTNNGVEFSSEYITEMIVNHECHAVEIEGNSAWKFVAIDIREKVLDRHEDCNFRIVKNHKNKETRILAESTWIKNNCYFDKDYRQDVQYSRFMDIMGEYMIDSKGKSQKDDPQDAMAGLSVHCKKYLPHLWRVKKKDEYDDDDDE